MIKGRYSGYIRPFLYSVDLMMINLFFYSFIDFSLNMISHIFISLSWLVISWNVGFYEVYRFTKPVEIITKIFNQFLFFTICYFAYLGFTSPKIDPYKSLNFVVLIVSSTALLKLGVYYFLIVFRRFLGGNLRYVIILGNDSLTNELIYFFNKNPDYGYKIQKIFDLKKDKSNQILAALDYISNHYFDDIYCSLEALNEDQLSLFEEISDKTLKTLKYIPKAKNQLANLAKVDYLGYIPVIPMRNIPLDNPTNYISKRIFDIVFSSLIIVFVLSWLIPILGIIIKLESKGPIFFKQKRNGLNYKEFICFKFRSLHLNSNSDIELVTKNDVRITTVGKFIRKTSIDELPQFINVFLGDMSIVGPRPQMLSVNKDYLSRIDKFMVRHYIKPGITGLAQVSGFRGEVETNDDIINRVKFDIFYIEKWSFILDIKIILNTIIKTLIGDKKAY